MGHLTRIANCIVHSTEKGPNSALVQQRPSEVTGQGSSVASVGLVELRVGWKDSWLFKQLSKEFLLLPYIIWRFE